MRTVFSNSLMPPGLVKACNPALKAKVIFYSVKLAARQSSSDCFRVFFRAERRDATRVGLSLALRTQNNYTCGPYMVLEGPVRLVPGSWLARANCRTGHQAAPPDRELGAGTEQAGRTHTDPT